MPADTPEPAPGPIVLRAGDGGDISADVEIDLAAGCRIAQITVSSGGERVGLLTTPDARIPSSTGWGSFPMAPWAGRIRNGRFRFRGDDIRLELNHDDGSGVGGGAIEPPVPAPTGPITDEDRRRHSIHGTTFSRTWNVVDEDTDHIEATCSLVGALGWPFPGVARQRIMLTPRRLDVELGVEPAAGSIFPASVGWHPWFVKPERLTFHPVAMYALDPIGLPTDELVTPSPPPWDDCFVNHEPVTLHYARHVAPVVTVDSPDCDHWVVYDMPADATCVEPQSGPPDATTLRPDVATSHDPLRRTMSISW